jgi:hypothetical protein
MAENKTSPIRTGGLVLVGLVLVALTGLLIDTIIDIFPAVGVQSELCKQGAAIPESQRAEFLETIKRAGKVNCKFGDLPVTRVNLGGTHTFMSADQALVAISAIMAAIGALLRSLISLGMATTARTTGELSITWTLLRPVMAAALGIVVYLALRALFQPPADLVRVNPYGYMVVAALVGLFADRILAWIGETGRSLVGK